MLAPRPRPAAGLLAAVFLTAVGLAAQAPAPPAAADQSEQPVFKSGVDSVSVDVIVTDKQGRPVLDLAPADFEIREEGKPQTIQAFKLIQTDDGRDDLNARPILSLEDQQREAAREDNRLLVIYLDDYHVRLENSMMVRERIAQFVSELSPHDLVAVAVPLLPAATLTFSRNHEATASEIMGFVGRKYDYRPKNRLEEEYAYELPDVQERLRNSWTIASLRGICEFMSSFREGRKTLLYVSEGMSNTLPAGVKTLGFAGIPGAPPVAGPDPEGRAASQQYFNSVELLSDLQRVFGAATRTNTAIYTLDPRGLAVSEYGTADVVTATMDRQILQQSTDVLRSMAEETDGRAIVNRNNFLPGLQQMIQDSATYYLLGYTSAAAPRDGRFHEIQVRVKRKDVEVRARKGYWAISADEASRLLTPPAPPVPEAVTTALNALGGEETSRRGGVTLWTGTTRGTGTAARLTLAWEAGADPTADSADRVDHLEVTATSAAGDVLFRGRSDRDPQVDQALGQVVFDAPAGSVHIAVESQNAGGRRIELNDTTVDVPDFTSTGAQLTNPFVFRARTARDLQQIRAETTPRATAGRSFLRAERLLLRFDAYGPGGVLPTVAARLLNQSGAEIVALPAPAHTSGNTFELVLALGPFPPGNYVVEISGAVPDDTVKRFVAFRVTG
jgi:VWFA-related protein